MLNNSPIKHIEFLSGGGKMGALMRAYDWEKSILGSPATWPHVLKIVIRLALTSKHPMSIWWGEELIQFYNDAYRKTLRLERHPCALGQRGRACKEEIWDTIGPQIEFVMAGKGATWHAHQPLAITRHGKQETIWWTYGHSPIEDESGVRGVLVICNDITKEHVAFDELRAIELRLQSVMELSGTDIWEWKPMTNEVVLSPGWKHMLGYEDNEIQSKFESWQSRIHPDDRMHALEVIDIYRNGVGDIYENEYRMRCKNGDWIRVHSLGAAVMRDAAGRPTKVIGTNSDISDKRRSEEKIWHQANFDELTGLPNRCLFKNRLDWEIQKADRCRYAVNLLFIDLDRFKEVNDLLGHAIGDTVLKEAAQRISDCVRASDTVARLGGDEFTVIITHLVGELRVEHIAQKILDALSAVFNVANKMIYLSASIGITIFNADTDTPEVLLRNADQAMYAAKGRGRNQFCFFTPSMQTRSLHRLRLIADLRHALKKKQLQVFYQPLSELATGKIFKAEALLRWFHPELGPVDPAEFIPLAEESGLINEIGDWVFKDAVSWSEQWSSEIGMPFQVSVNKSPAQFVSRVKNTDWTDYLNHKGLSGQNISLEITEGVLLQASTFVIEKLLTYRDAGIQISLDDFGTGYSSMTYLQKFHIDYLKIDQSFIRDMASNPADRAIVRSIIVMAHELGLKVIAESIETQEQVTLLTTAKCDFGQGFFYSRAIPPEQMTALIQKNGRRLLHMHQ